MKTVAFSPRSSPPTERMQKPVPNEEKINERCAISPVINFHVARPVNLSFKKVVPPANLDAINDIKSAPVCRSRPV